jgi:hypothetical protein
MRDVLMALLLAVGALALAACTGAGPSPGPTPTGTDAPAPAPTPTPLPPASAAQAQGDGAALVDGVRIEPLVAPDPDWQEELNEGGFFVSTWTTDFSRHSVPYAEVRSGGVRRDGIPPIDHPRHVGVTEADGWLAPREPVILLEVAGEARAYPLQVLTWHEIVNDELAGEPVAVTFCPLCNAAVAFDRRVEGQVYTFGVSGNLRNSDLIMWDRQTESWWQQFTGEGIVGVHTGRRLTVLPAPIVAWETFRDAHPEGSVLSRETGYTRPYGTNPYSGYDRVDNPPFLYDGPLDGRLLPKERVAAVGIGGAFTAYPYPVLERERAVNDAVRGEPVVVLFVPGTRSALDRRSIADSREVGSTGVFSPLVDGTHLVFTWDGERFTDTQTGSTWDSLGRALAGPLAGAQLERIAHQDHFWFAWAAFRPDTRIYPG